MPQLIPVMLAGLTAGLTLVSWATRADPRIRSRVADLMPPRTERTRRIRVLSGLTGRTPVHALLRSRGSKRRRGEVERHVLEFVELLVAATEAGLPPGAAVQRCAGLVRGPLGVELQRAGREIALGLDWRAALEQVRSRTQAVQLGTLLSALGRAHRLGTSAQGALRAIADELRVERRTRADEAARRAPVKMLFPLVFLILPAFLLLTVGPVLLATIRSLH
jgi:tight adherence protein C